MLISAVIVSVPLVALRKESVDRNAHVMLWLKNSHVSLSARRAWIEICLKSLLSAIALVALRKESVDRNKRTHRIQTIAQVALRKESVDRNL